MAEHKIFTMSFSKVYPLYIAKVERKGRSKEELDLIINWLTGYSHQDIQLILKNETNFRSFFKDAPHLNPLRTLIKGVVCGVRVEEIKDTLMQEIRYMDKLVDELAKGRKMDKILRK